MDREPRENISILLSNIFQRSRIRITNMLAEYWDEANLGLLAIEGMKEGLGFHQEVNGV